MSAVDLLVFVPWSIPWASYPLKVTCVFNTVAALRINWAGVICARVVWSRSLEPVSTSVKRNFLNNRTPISARFGHGVCGPVGSLFTLCIRMECLHVMRLVGGHIRTNRLRVHLKSVHPLTKLSNDFRWRGCGSIQNNRKIQRIYLQSLPIHGPER